MLTIHRLERYGRKRLRMEEEQPLERPHVPPELRDLIDRVAAHPHGLGFLNQAYLDSVAVTLGVHPFVVEAAREYLATPEGRAVMIEEVRRSRERVSPAEGPVSDEQARPASTPSPMGGSEVSKEETSGGPEELITKARGHQLGVRFLLEAPPETVAVNFGVHPFVVFRARGILTGHDPGAEDATSAELGGEG